LDSVLLEAASEEAAVAAVKQQQQQQHEAGAANMVAIAVRASGMNFRDVLIVLKPELFPDHKGDIGFECSGVVTAVSETG
jgi:NADPH:quinone reductase-like Zn-dependent oxidoreductase